MAVLVHDEYMVYLRCLCTERLLGPGPRDLSVPLLHSMGTQQCQAYEHTENTEDAFLTTVKELRTFLKQWKNDTEVTGTVWLFLYPDPSCEAVVFAELDVASMNCVILDEIAELWSVRESSS